MPPKKTPFNSRLAGALMASTGLGATAVRRHLLGGTQPRNPLLSAQWSITLANVKGGPKP